jgi:hypothetical protein
VLMAGVLQGCLTVTDSKSLIIKPEPGETAIAVTSKATVRCQDFFFVISCQLELDLKQVK